MHGTLALLLRSVRADAIRRQPHAFRIGSVLLILAMLLASHVNTGAAGTPGLDFFRMVSWLMAALVTLAAMGHFATAITEEKEEGTLGLLLIADLSPLSILLGKSTNRIFSALLVFAAQFPFALLALALGGITLRQIICVYLALSAYMFLMANLALLVSVLSQRTGIALAGMIALTIIMNGLIPAIDNAVTSLISARRLLANGIVDRFSDRLLDLHERTSVFLELDRILDPTRAPNPFTLQIGLSLLFGVLAFAAAWVAFRRIIWTADLASPPRPVSTRRKRWSGAFSRRPWRLPFVWKDFYFLAGGPAFVAVKLILYPIVTLLILRYDEWVEDLMDASAPSTILMLLFSVLIIEFLAYSSQLFHLEQKWGTLPTLLMLPKSAGQMAYGKLLGCILASTPTLLAIAVVMILFPDQLQALKKDLRDPIVISVICGFLILCQLTVLCSLIVNWGALPLAAAIMLILGVFVAPFLGTALMLIRNAYEGAADYVQYGPFLYATGILSAGIQLETARRIHISAGS